MSAPLKILVPVKRVLDYAVRSPQFSPPHPYLPAVQILFLRSLPQASAEILYAIFNIIDQTPCQ